MQTLKQTIQEAENKKIAIGHFNIANLEQLKAIVNVARRLNVPVIVGVSEGEREYIGVSQIAALIKAYQSEGLPIFLNADHTHSLEKAREAAMAGLPAQAGLDAIVFDASSLPFDENVNQTAEAVHMIKEINPKIIVEGELGYIGSGSEVFKKLPKGAAIKTEDLTKPEDALRFVEETEVDMLAPAVGNIHGMFANAPNPRLDIDRIRKIKKSVKIPLVLHGGSGIRDEDFIDATHAGISIIHISTEIRLAWRKGIEQSLKDNPNEAAPYKITAGAIQEMEKAIENRLRLFNRL